MSGQRRSCTTRRPQHSSCRCREAVHRAEPGVREAEASEEARQREVVPRRGVGSLETRPPERARRAGDAALRERVRQRIRAVRNAGSVSNRRSYFWAFITLACGLQFTSPGSTRGGAAMTVPPAVCALARGIVPARQAAAKAKYVAIFIIIPSPLCVGPHSHLSWGHQQISPTFATRP